MDTATATSPAQPKYLAWVWQNKIREARLRLYGHGQRQDGDHCIKHILEAEVHGRWSRGRQRNRWINTIPQDLITSNLTQPRRRLSGWAMGWAKNPCDWRIHSLKDRETGLWDSFLLLIIYIITTYTITRISVLYFNFLTKVLNPLSWYHAHRNHAHKIRT